MSSDMNNLNALFGGLQNNSEKEKQQDPNSKPKMYEEYKKEKKDKKKKKEEENEYKAFKLSVKRAEKYLEKFDKAKLSNKDKKKLKL